MTGDRRDSTDAWVTCALGHRHWGVLGAAGLLLRRADADGTTRFLLQLRGPDVHHPGVWGLPGGAIRPGDTPVGAAVRETREETGWDPVGLQIVRVDVDDHGGWAYHVVVAESSPPPLATGRTDEQERTAWFSRAEALELPVHPSMPGILSRADG